MEGKHVIVVGCRTTQRRASDGDNSKADLLLSVPESGRCRQSENHNFFARYRTDVVMQAHDLDASDLLDHRFHHGARRFDEVRANLFQQVPALLRLERSDELLLSRGQYALEANDDQIADQVSVNVLWATAHVILLESSDSLTDVGFNFSLRLHGIPDFPLGRPNPRVLGKVSGNFVNSHAAGTT
jgi:hypothetical protein